MSEYDGEDRQTKVTDEQSSELSTSSTADCGLPPEASDQKSSELSSGCEPSSSPSATLNDADQNLPSDDSNYDLSSSTKSTDLPVPTQEASVKSSLAQLAFQKFENYINETRADQIVPPLQEMICGYGQGLARLAQSTQAHLQLPSDPLQLQNSQVREGKVHEPIALRRHIHSTPLLRRTPDSILSAINDEDECGFDDDDEDYPPPAGLEILDFARSRSTPLTRVGSENSAFGTILRTSTHGLSSDCGGSAFSLQPYAMKKAKSRSDERPSRPVTFNPIVDEDEILKTVDGDNNSVCEMTSIEVTDVPVCEEPKKKKSVASRTAKFLADIRNLRITGGSGNKRSSSGGRGMRYRPRDGRENPARPPSISSDEQSRASTITSVATSNVTDKKDQIRPVIVAISTATAVTADKSVADKSERSATTQEESNAIEASQGVDRVTIQMNDNTSSTINVANQQSYSACSPEPNEILDQSIRDSPNSTRFPPSISSSSGRISQGTSTSSNGRSHGSYLSIISETDQEVANVNVLQRDRRLQIVGEKIELSLSSDPSSSIRSGDLNTSVSIASPDSSVRRDGASVQADRFFKYRKDSNKPRHFPPFTRKSVTTRSPTMGSACTIGSDEPPKIVSTFDRKQISDLSSLYHRQYPFETSSPRADDDHEVRDSSPSDQIQGGPTEIIFEGVDPEQTDMSNVPRAHRPSHGITTGFGRKNRSLPPRSPINNTYSSTTPPPRGGSPAYNAISPPRQIVDHHLDSISGNLSKPYVVAPTSHHSAQSMHTAEVKSAYASDTNQVSNEVLRLSPNCDYYNLKPEARRLSPVYNHQAARTYEQSGIEILKSDSKDDNTIPLVTPDKGEPSS